MDRPPGVGFLAILTCFGGLFQLFYAAMLAHAWAPADSVVQPALGFASIAFGIGLWRMQEWAWAASLVLKGLDGLTVIGLWVQYGPLVKPLIAVFSLLVDAVVVIFLLQPRVRREFRS